VLIAGVLLVSAEPWHPGSTVATYAVFILFAGAAIAVALVPLLRLPFGATLVRHRSPEACVPHTVHISTSYLAVEEDAAERRFGWEEIQDVRVTRDLVVVDVPNRRVVLPTRVFTSSAERTAALERLGEGRRRIRTSLARLHRRLSDPFAPPRRSGP